VIELSHIVKKYGQRRVVDDLNLTIKPGRIYGFLGPNGAGKTTTMNIITGYLAATSGTVLINDVDILAQPEVAKRFIGYLPEQPPLYMDMKVGEYLRFAAAIKQIPKAEREQAVDDAMEKAHVVDVEGRLIRNLSKGYRQRVGLAQAILGDPEIVILDEPTVGLDPSQIIEIRQLVKRLGRNHTVILSSHILSEVTEVCDYVFIIANGKLVANDTTQNLLKPKRGDYGEIEVLVRGNGTKEKNLFSGFSYQVKSLQVLPAADGESLLRIKVAGHKDRRQEYLKLLMRSESEVLEYRIVGKSLEERFLELTNQIPVADDEDYEDEPIVAEPEDETVPEADTVPQDEPAPPPQSPASPPEPEAEPATRRRTKSTEPKSAGDEEPAAEKKPAAKKPATTKAATTKSATAKATSSKTGAAKPAARKPAAKTTAAEAASAETGKPTTRRRKPKAEAPIEAGDAE
jgi:ABC-2 type transport system ATP-binding protein